MKTDHLLFGAAYYSEYLPYDRVEKDMEMMEKAGMNTIRIAESTWSTIEPKDGIFDFTHLDKMLEAAARHHISVIVGTPTYAIPAWLAKKYPDINEFNREFGLDYWSNCVNTWEDFPDIRGTINESLAAEFAKFQRLLVTRFLAWQAAIVSGYKRPDQFITQNFDYDWTDHSIGYQPEVNQYEAARCMTVAGCDIYHPSQSLLTGEEITFCGNISRSLKKDNYLVLETQAQGNIAWLPYPGQLRLQAYSHIANGSNSVMYWHWHSIHNAIESYWKGILSHDFSENETYREAASIGADWKRIGTHLSNLQKKNRAAILLDNNSLTGLRLFPLKDLGNYSYNTVARWLGDALYHLNIEYDMISSAERDFSSYECLIVPALYSASEDLLTAISDYVKNGGHLITTFRSGFSDEQLKIYADTQPHILQECLGIHYDQYTYPVDVSVTLPDFMASDVGSSCSDESCTNSSKCLHWMDLVTCDTATPLFFYDHPVRKKYAAATVNQFGKGSALYLSSMFDGALLEKVLVHYFASLPETLLAHPECHFPLIIREGVNDFGKRVRFYFNYSGEKQTAICKGISGTELLSGRKIMEQETLPLEPWGVVIVEEN